MGMSMNANLREVALSELPELKVHGRTTANRSPLTLFWTGSAVELNATGAELWVEVEAEEELYEPWISVTINGAWISRQMVTSGRHWICLFRGMNATAVKNVRIIKETQAMSGEQGCTLKVHALRLDGQLKPVLGRPFKLEFIGDSITSGEGAIGAREEEDWIPMIFSAVHNYTAITAEALNADYRVMSQSGWGVMTSWDNNPHASIPKYYEQVCGLLAGEKNEAVGALQENDFSSWQPDVIVVNLGTNDNSAFHSPAWGDEHTGQIYKQRLNEDGSYNEQDLQAFEAAAEQFLMKLRRCNPKSHIVWAYGMLGTPMLPAIKRAVAGYASHTGDGAVSVLELPEMTDDTTGARAHPGIGAHERAAGALVEFIKPLLMGRV